MALMTSLLGSTASGTYVDDGGFSDTVIVSASGLTLSSALIVAVNNRSIDAFLLEVTEPCSVNVTV
jgi:hypothetical protein